MCDYKCVCVCVCGSKGIGDKKKGGEKLKENNN